MTPSSGTWSPPASVVSGILAHPGPAVRTWGLGNQNEDGRFWMLLQAYRTFDNVGDYDPTTGRFDIFSRRAEPNRAAGPPLGAFDYIGGKRMMLYRLADCLYLQI